MITPERILTDRRLPLSTNSMMSVSSVGVATAPYTETTLPDKREDCVQELTMGSVTNKCSSSSNALILHVPVMPDKRTRARR